MNINDFIKHFKIESIKKNTFQAICPNHDDHQASLTISYDKKTDNIVLYCHAGCPAEDILNKVNLNMKDLFNNNIDKNSKNLKEVAKYIYQDENYNDIHCTIRYIDSTGKKIFKQAHYENGKLVYNMRGIKTYLYKLPELINDIALDRDIFIVEGEKDVDTLRALGVSATTSPMGAGKWRNEYNHYFKDAKVIILPDNDEVGLNHAKLIVSNLKGIAKSLKVIELPYLKEKEDVSNWLEKGNNINALYDLVYNTSEYNNNSNVVINKIVEEVDIAKELEEINDYIYYNTNVGRPKLQHDKVIELLLEKYNICVSYFGNKRKYFIYEDGYWKDVRKEYIGSLFVDWLLPFDKVITTLDKVVDYLFYKTTAYVDEHIFNNCTNKINLKNCTFNLDTYQAEPHSPKDYFTHKLDYSYIENAKCPTFINAITEYSLNNTDWLNAFFEIAGYVLTGTYEYQKMFWFTGSKGRNGKGTCVRVLENLVGDHYTISDIDTREFREKFYKVRFMGKRLATAGDLHSRLANVATLKQLTGGDKQTSDVKFGDNVSFINNAKIVFAMNQLPQLPPNENITPVAKRILILPFEFEIVNPNANIENRIMNELSGIFNLAIEGLKRLRKNDEFTYVERGDTVLQMYQKNLPIFEQFVEDNITYKSKGTNGIFLYEIWEKYQKFMNDLFGGEHWKYDKDIEVRNSWHLGNQIRDYFLLRNIKLATTKKYSGNKLTTAVFLPELEFSYYNVNEEYQKYDKNDEYPF